MWLWALLTWLLFGLVIGALARLLMPGRQPIGFLGTVLLGIVGSFIGGFFGYLLGGREPLSQQVHQLSRELTIRRSASRKSPRRSVPSPHGTQGRNSWRVPLRRVPLRRVPLR